MKKILISQMDKLGERDIVELIDDDSLEVVGYFVGAAYRDKITKIPDDTQYLSSTQANKARLDEAVKQIEGEEYALKKIET